MNQHAAFGWWDVWIPLGIAALLPLHCLWSSHGKMFWMDEVATYVMAADPSLPHMLAALDDTLNAIPPLYFVTAWCWARVFGASALSLRMFSSLALAAGVYVTWRMLRLGAGRVATTLAVLLLIVASVDIPNQNVEARCYGLYFAGFAAASAAVLFTAHSGEHVSWRLCMATALANAVLVSAHYVGGVLSAALLGCALVSWLATGRRKWLAHSLFIVLGWSAFMPSIPFLLTQQTLASEASWVPPPEKIDLLNGLACGWLGLDYVVALCAIGLLAARTFRDHRADPMGESTRIDPPHADESKIVETVYVASGLAAVPALWIISNLGPRVFLGRYFFPLALVWGVCASAAIDRLLIVLRMDWAAGKPRRPEERARLVIVGACLLGLAVMASGLMVDRTLGAADEPRELVRGPLAYLERPHSAPLVTTSLHVLLPLSYSRPELECLFVMPRSAAAARRNTPASIAGALARHYHFPSVRSAEDVEASFDRVAAVEEEIENWPLFDVFQGWPIVERFPELGIVIVERPKR